MVREIDPERSRRAAAFALWNRAPMPMVTLMKTLDVTRLVRLSRRRGYKINMLLCWCVGRRRPAWRIFIFFRWGTS